MKAEAGHARMPDVSGFTSLAEALAVALGPQRGAEVLTRHLDSVYGPLIASVEQYCGSVVGFSGDAITYWFEQDTGRRATFLDNVPAHRAPVAAWRQHLDGEQEAA